MNLADEIERAVAAADFGTASARKSGRRAEWPYVPVVVHPHGNRTRDEQILLKAFETRAEAVKHAERVIANRRTALAIKLADPKHRALREQYGLPREIV